MIPVSTVNTLITAAYLRTQKENQYFERKGIGEADTKPSKIAEEIVGMLNADGGVLAFGVANDGTLQDLNQIKDTLDKYRSLVFDFIHPPCYVELEEIIVDGKLIFLYHVEQELERVFSIKDNEKVYLRVLDTNRALDREHVKKLEYDKGIRKFEEEIVRDFDLDDLDSELLEAYKEKLNYTGNALDLLVKRHLAKKSGENFEIKNSAVLLFAKEPEKYIPSASVRYVRFEGKEALTGASHNVVKDERFESNIPTVIQDLRNFLKAAFKDYHFLDVTIGKFRRVAEYPEEAWLEGIVNALCHRSYNVQGNSIYIKHYDDRIEMSNSGPLPAQVTIENIKTERFARNPRVARVLEDLGYVRQLNEGVKRIYESMEKSMLSIPEYKEENGNVFLILRNKISEHSKTIPDILIKQMEANWGAYNDTQKSILSYLFFNHQATLAALVDYTSINMNTIRSYVNKFVEEGILERNTEKIRDLNALYTFRKDKSVKGK